MSSIKSNNSMHKIDYCGDHDNNDKNHLTIDHQDGGLPERSISKESAQSIIGGVSPKVTSNSPNYLSVNNLSNAIPSIHLSDSSNKSSSFNKQFNVNNSAKNVLTIDQIANGCEGSDDEDDDDNDANSINPDGMDDEQTKKVFNFAFPFSNNDDDEEDEDDEESSEVSGSNSQSENRSSIVYVDDEDDEKRITQLDAHQPPYTDSMKSITKAYEHKNEIHHSKLSKGLNSIPLISKTARRVTKFVLRTKKKERSVIQHEKSKKHSSHPVCPHPPPGVAVYWDDIVGEFSSTMDEIKDREIIKLKLERQESIDTLEEARYYRDISSLDDGKFKALRKSILPAANPINVSNAITSKIRKSDSTSIYENRSASPMSIQNSLESRSKSQPLQTNQPGQQPPQFDSPIPAAAASAAILADNLTTSQIPPPSQQMAQTSSTSSTLLTNPINHITSLNGASSRILSSIPMSPVASLFQSNMTPDVYDELEGDVIILGGYRGSILRDAKTKKRTWIPVLKAGLNISKTSLLIGPKREDELYEARGRKNIVDELNSIGNDDNETGHMYPDGMLTHIGPVDISRRLLRKLNSNPNVTAKHWGYDWRLSLDILSEQLHEEIKRMNEKSTHKKGIILIAHSMGGLVAHGAMIKDPSIVRGVIYCGTPMPCSNILGPLRFTDAILLSKDILSNEANFFMRSSYVFLPPSWGGEDEEGKNGGMCLFRDLRNGKRYKIDFWNADNWIEFNLNPLVSNIRLKHDVKNGLLNLNNIKDDELRHTLKRFLKMEIDPKTESIVLHEIKRLNKPMVPFLECYSYLKDTLKRTSEYIKSLEYQEGVNYPPMSQIFSNGVPSVKYSLVDGEESIKRGEYYRFFYGPGDGVVYQGWTFPREKGRRRPEGEEDICGKGSVDRVGSEGDWRAREYGYGQKYAYELCGRIRSTAGHIGLLTDLKLMGDAISSIIEEEKKRQGLVN